MSRSPEELLAVWNAASSHPFQPFIAKDSQFTTASLLLLTALLLTGVFAFSTSRL
jgi:hypothetical protein